MVSFKFLLLSCQTENQKCSISIHLAEEINGGLCSYRKALIPENFSLSWALGKEERGLTFIEHLFCTRYLVCPTSHSSTSKWGDHHHFLEKETQAQKS